VLLVIVVPAKVVIERLNPSYNRYSPHTLLDGFPSGHAAAACVCYILAVLIIAPRPGGRAQRIALGAVTVLALGAGLALVWLGIHRFTDVVAGWALAALVIPLAMRVTGLRAGPPPGHAEQSAGPRAVSASADRGTR
jgi:undecaprenyl-diphosphatase